MLLLLVTVAAIVLFLRKNIDSIVKDAIERYASSVTRTEVRVSSVSLRLAEGAGSIKGLTVANPEGFSAHHAFSLSRIDVKIDPASLTTDKVIIDSVMLKAPVVRYEISQSGTSNIGVLKDHVQAAIQTRSKLAGKGSKNNTRLRKYHIRKLVIEKGQVSITISPLDERTETLELRRVELKDIGKGGGASPEAVAEEVTSALIEETGLAVARAGIEGYLGGEINGTLRHILGN